MFSNTLPVCPKTGSTSPSLTVHLCLHTVPGNRECARVQPCSPQPGTIPSSIVSGWQLLDVSSRLSPVTAPVNGHVVPSSGNVAIPVTVRPSCARVNVPVSVVGTFARTKSPRQPPPLTSAALSTVSVTVQRPATLAWTGGVVGDVGVAGESASSPPQAVSRVASITIFGKQERVRMTARSYQERRRTRAG